VHGRAKEFDETTTYSGVVVSAKAGEGERDLDRRTTRLATERAALFEKAGDPVGLSVAEQQRLKVIERELDECFLARRRERALADARRFDRDAPFIRRVPRPSR
jgi:hypothetical protein